MNLTDPIYHDADKAREHIEKLHWPHGPTCPHCGSVENITKLQGKSTRPGVYKCNACERFGSVRTSQEQTVPRVARPKVVRK